jgi:hypothetical protein
MSHIAENFLGVEGYQTWGNDFKIRASPQIQKRIFENNLCDLESHMGSTDEKSSGKKVSSNCAFSVHRYNICKLYASCITVWAPSLPIIIKNIASQKAFS